MNLPNLDIRLTWDDLQNLLYKTLKDRVSIFEIKSRGSSVVIEGSATGIITAPWTLCFEPLPCEDGKCLVLHIQSFELEGGLARTGFKLFKNLIRFDWSREDEETLVEICSNKIPGASAQGRYLYVDLADFFSSWTGSSVRMGTIKSFVANRSGLHLVIRNSK